eukprot:COSAG01_NODE_61837_length_287_cov_1.372340_1_plen_51_part_10
MSEARVLRTTCGEDILPNGPRTRRQAHPPLRSPLAVTDNGTAVPVPNRAID